jgi:hypothetical protein
MAQALRGSAWPMGSAWPWESEVPCTCVRELGAQVPEQNWQVSHFIAGLQQVGYMGRAGLQQVVYMGWAGLQQVGYMGRIKRTKTYGVGDAFKLAVCTCIKFESQK